MNFAQQLLYCSLFHQIDMNSDTIKTKYDGEICQMVIAARIYAAKQGKMQELQTQYFPAKESPKKRKSLRKQLRKICKRIVSDGFILKHACSVKQGHQMNFHPSSEPQFDFELEIDETLLLFRKSGVAPSPFVAYHVAVQCCAKKGIIILKQ